MVAGEGVGPEKPVNIAWEKEGIGWVMVLECAEVWAEKAPSLPHTGKEHKPRGRKVGHLTHCANILASVFTGPSGHGNHLANGGANPTHGFQ